MIRRLQLLGIVLAIFAVLGIGARQLRAYATEGHVWSVSSVPYYINPTNKYISSSAAIAAIKSSAAAWTGYANIQLSYAGTTSDAGLTLNYQNTAFFRDDSSSLLAETYYWWDGTGKMVDADFVIHENWIWYSANIGCNGDGYYVENTATHEFGHVLGLAHSSVDTATMWPTAGLCETIRETLDPDDIAGLQSIYPGGNGGGGSPTPTAPSAPSQLSAITDGGSPTSSLDLAWVDNSTNASGYVVQRGTDGVNFSQVASLGAGSAAFTDSGLAAGTAYYYRVYAYNTAGSSGYSNTATGQTQTATSPTPPPPSPTVSAPSAPSNPSPGDGSTNVNTSLTLAWTSSGATSYNVYVNGALRFSNLKSASVKLSGLASSQTYSWSVVASNSAGSTQGPTWTFTTSKKGGPKR